MREENDPVNFKRTTAALARIVFPGKIGARIGSVRNLVVVPILGIGSIPFAALRPLPNQPQLVETTAVTIAPSLFELRREPVTWQRVFRRPLVIGDPDLSNDREWDFPALPGARHEAEAVGTFLGARPLLGKAATLANVKQYAPEADFLYLATHGIANPDDPLMRSFIALASSGGLSGNWTAADIQRSRLQAKLVVLSACQTGLGKEQDAGIIGIARAFTLAGVPRVMVSLWNIGDQPTVPVMKSFVRNLKSQPPALALRLAMLKIRKADPNPANWAAFMIFGAP